MKLNLNILAAGLLLPLAALAADPHSDGRTFMAQGDSNSAAKKFGEAAQINPFDASALNNQAVALAAQGDNEKAMQLLERAARLAPNRADIAANLNELRSWLNRNNPASLSQKKMPVMNAYPASGQVPPEPPPLWKTPAR